MRTSKCKSCGADIVWAITQAGKKTPLDAKPTRVAVVDECAETGETLTREGLPLIDGVDGYTSHFATCPNAAQHRRRK